MKTSKKKILVLYHFPPLGEMRVGVLHHLRALENSDVNHDLLYYNTIHGVPSWLRHLHFDALILHNTLLCMRWSPIFYSWKWNLRWIKDLKCLKIAMPQDEYDHAEILDEWLYEWGISIIFTNFGESYRKDFYPFLHNIASFYKHPTGYIDGAVAQEYSSRLLPLDERPNDIVYRASKLPYWFGSHGQLKYRIGEVVRKSAEALQLRCDISTRLEDTITGSHWLDFLASGKTVIGCESGSSVLDRRGEIQAQIKALLKGNPNFSFEEISERMPGGWDDYRFFAISPRHFEAIMTKTCQILIEGDYDGVLEREKHYIPLKKDFSNINEVLEKIKDVQYLAKIADQAYQDIYMSGKYTYQKLVDDINSALSQQQSKTPLDAPKRIVEGLGLIGGHFTNKVTIWMAILEYRFWHSIRHLIGSRS